MVRKAASKHDSYISLLPPQKGLFNAILIPIRLISVRVVELDLFSSEKWHFANQRG